MELLTESPSVEVPGQSPTPRRRKWPFAAVAAIVLGGAAAGIVLTRGDDPPRQGRNGALAEPQPDLHYVFDAAPTTWVAFNAGDFVPTEFSMSWVLWGDYQSSMYGTQDDPSAPAIILGVGDQLNDGGFAGIGQPLTGQTQWTTDRTAGICGTDGAGVRRCFVEVDGTQVQAHSSGMTDEALTAVLKTLRVRDGIPELDAAAMPAGMSHLGSWRNRMPTGVGENGDAIISGLQYHGPDQAMAILSVGRADEHDIAAVFDVGAHEATTIDGVTYFHGTSSGGMIEFVAWQHDGRAFQMMATPDKGIDLVDLARSVRPATPEEWAAAVVAPKPVFPPSKPSSDTTPQLVAPQPAPVPADVRDVPVTVSAVERPDLGGIIIVTELPDGSATPINVLRQGDTTSIGVDDEYGTFSGGDDSDALVSFARSATSWGAYIITSDPRAATLRVTRANGDRYVAALVPDPVRDGLRVAAVVVPIDEFVGADLLDEFGRQIDSIGFTG